MIVEERRRSARYPFYASAEITEPTSRYFVIARTNELSRTGCYMDMVSPLGAGSALEVRIVHEGDALNMPARVVHSQPNVGMGLSFDAKEPAQAELLDRWLAALG